MTNRCTETTDKANVTILVWDCTGNLKVPVTVYSGDELEYKRNGQRGWMRCSVFKVWEGRITLMPIVGGRRFVVNVKSRGFAQLFRNGQRVLP